MNKGMPKGRNAAAESACFRKAGVMVHKNEPRGGSKNVSKEYFQEYLEEQEYPDYEMEAYSGPFSDSYWNGE